MAFNPADPNSVSPVTGLPAGQQKRRNLTDILSDPAFQQGGSGPGLADNSAAYSAALKSAQANAATGEAQDTANVLDQLQSRGLAKSGIALKDVVQQVLGPAQNRSDALAAQFGLQQAQDATNMNTQERQIAANQNSQALGGRLNAILQSGQQDASADSQALSGLQNFSDIQEQGALGELQNKENNANQAAIARNQRKSDTKNTIIGGLLGAGGSALAAFCFRPDMKVNMFDGTKKEIGQLKLDDKTQGGIVLSIRRAKSKDMHTYKGIYVTGSHSVKDDGVWKRIKDAKSNPVEGNFEVVSIITSNHRIYMGDIEFDDEMELNRGNQSNKDEHIEILNEVMSPPTARYF